MSVLYRCPGCNEPKIIGDRGATTVGAFEQANEVSCLKCGYVLDKKAMEAACMERVAIVGSRKFYPLSAVADYVNALPDHTVVVSGGAHGVDSTAEQAARKRGLTVHVFEAQWSVHGRAAGPIRNREMIATVDRVVAFWDGASPGTRNAITLAAELGKPCEVFR